MIEREREKNEKQPFSSDFTGFCQLELNRTRVKAALRDKSYAWVLESQDFTKVRVSWKPRKGGVPGNHAN